MERDQAEQQAQELQDTHPDRLEYRFVARQSADGGWEVAKVRLPQELRRAPLTPTIEAAPRPSPADDPRSIHERHAPGTGGGGL